jgi:ankyrin repeat protein
MLLDAGADANAVDEEGWSVVAYAASFGWSEAVHQLAKAGADVDRPDTTYGRTPLMKAAVHGRVSTVSALLKAGADVDVESSDEVGRWTALTFATRNAHHGDKGKRGLGREGGEVRMEEAEDALRFDLGDGGVGGGQGSGDGDETGGGGAEEDERSSQWVEVMKLLLAAGARVDCVSTDAYTPLMIAAAFNATDAVELLLSHGADPNHVNGEGESVLAHTSEEGVRLLVREAIVDRITRY